MLRFETVHVDGQLGSALDVRQIQKFPSKELRSVRKVRVFGERVVLPAAGVVDGLAAPDARGSVEIEKCTASRTATMLHDKVPIKQNCLHLRQQRVIAVEVGPPRLHHPDFPVLKVGNRAPQKVGLREKVRVENGHEFSARGF